MSKETKVPMPVASSFQGIFDRIECDSGLIFVDTPEETRLIREIYRKFKDDSIQFWSIGQGLHEIEKKKTSIDRFYPHKYNPGQARKGKGGEDSRANPFNLFTIIEEDCRDKIKPETQIERKTIYILRDLDKFLKDPVCLRRLKDLVYLCATACSTIVITGFGLCVPADVEKDSVFVKLNYPTRDEILNTIRETRKQIEEHNKKCKPEEAIDAEFDDEEVARACGGLTEDQIINVLQYTMTIDHKIDIPKILDEKKAIINKSDILDYWACNDNLNDVGGFGEIKEWFEIRKSIIQHVDNAKKFKAKPPKGIMLLGVQGSGKTLIAKALAKSWNVGLIKLDIGKVFAGLVGESEKRTRQALAQIDAAGGIVVIDELDKGLSGAGSSDKTDGGTTNRVIGTILTWLNEDHPGVFLIATANDITNLRTNHPELLRKGRFDEIWFSDIPTAKEREEIFSIHLRKKDRDPSKFDIKKLAEYEFEDSDGQKFCPTGAEIESAINDAVQNKFALGGGKELVIGGKDDISTDDVYETLRIIKPITKVAKVTISNMRRWSSDNARNVSKGEEVVKKQKSTKKISLREDSELDL